MKKREDIVQKFSTFLSFGDREAWRQPDRDRSCQSIWQADPQLERQMKRLTDLDSETKEEFWAKYFLKKLREVSQPESSTKMDNSAEAMRNFEGKMCDSASAPLRDRTSFLPVTNPQTLEISALITARHLSAYLQEACLWAAEKSYQKYNFFRYKYSIEEYFQIASSFANLPAKLLKNFNLDRPYSNIKSYAKITLFRFIRDKIYQQDLEAKRVKFSDYGLLKDVNAKELKEALKFQGINQTKIDLYRLAWQCFNEIYQPQQELGRRNLEPPDRENLKQIADYYNQRLNQLDLLGLVANEDTIQEMLAICIKAARNYRTKQVIPLEEYDNISDPTPTPWDIVIQKEENQQVQVIVSKLFAAIPEAGQTMLILWQGLDLTQSEIATVIKSRYPELQKQYQVARQLARYTKNILKDFVNEWNQVNSDRFINDEQDLERIKEALNECLQLHCKRLVNSILEQVTEEFSKAEKTLLFSQKLKLNQPPTVEVSNKVLKAKQSLTKAFFFKLETDFYLPVNAILPASNKIFIFVEEWLISCPVASVLYSRGA